MTAMPMWQPSVAAMKEAEMTRFRQFVEKRTNQNLANWPDFYQWSVDHIEDFWDSLWDFCDVIGEKGLHPITRWE